MTYPYATCALQQKYTKMNSFQKLNSKLNIDEPLKAIKLYGLRTGFKTILETCS